MIRKNLYQLRKLLFKNRLGEGLAKLLSPFPWLSAKITVPILQYEPGTFRLVKRNGTRLKLDISNEVDHFIYFKKRDTTFDNLHEEIRQAKTILDIGGNIGAFALFFEHLNPAATIYSFEPHPVTFSRLKENLAMNDSRIQAFQLGLGEKKDRLKLYEIDIHNAGMNKLFAEEQNYPSVTIDVDTLDGFWMSRGPIDFIKIDVEGFEHAVLKGAKNLLIEYAPILVIEVDDNNLRSSGTSAKELVEYLVSLQYDYIRTTDKGTVINPGTDFTNCHMDIVAKKLSR